MLANIQQGKHLLHSGKVIAYPTEAVFGLGCDAFNERACEKILQLKNRDSSKGLIVIIATWQQLEDLVFDLNNTIKERLLTTWPGHVTWLFPAHRLPRLITGANNSAAIRMTAHPVARALAEEMPIVSTSANITGLPPAIDIKTLQTQFPRGIDAIVEGNIGQATKPSDIFDITTGKQIR